MIAHVAVLREALLWSGGEDAAASAIKRELQSTAPKAYSVNI